MVPELSNILDSRTRASPHGINMAASHRTAALAAAKYEVGDFCTGLIGRPQPQAHDHDGAGRVSEDLPQGVSVGRDSSGQYRTAPLKEYPPAMCRALPVAFDRDLSAVCTGDEISIPEPFLQLAQKMQDKDFGAHIGHDG